ncbi:MAG: ester cyclase [Pyrinomonadaceae bacterium]
MRDSKMLLESWIADFNGKDLDAVTNRYAENAVNFQVAAGDPAIGRLQIKSDTREFFTGFPDAWAKVENLMGDGNRAAWEWIGGGTFKGEFYGNHPTGRSFELRGCGFFLFKDDKIVLQRGYWDKHTWFSQIGLEIG